MPFLAASETMPPQGHAAATELRQLNSCTSLPGLCFLMLCILIALGATRSIDWWGQRALAPLSVPVLDLTGFFLTLLGAPLITSTIAVVWAWHGWCRRREHGLGPLLLFVGVGVEVLLKYLLPHPGLPPKVTDSFKLPDLLGLSPAVWLQVVTPSVLLPVTPPYAFPSGHMLRATFLVAVAIAHRPQWRLLGWLVIFAMAFTRVYCEEHWMSDVVGGALLGWTLAEVANSWRMNGDERGLIRCRHLRATS